LKEDKIWNKNFTTITLSYMLLALGIYMIVPTIPLYITDLGATKTQVGMVATAFYVSSIITRLMINTVIAKVGRKRVLIAGFILSTIMMSSYGLARSVETVAMMRVLQGMAFGTISTISGAMAADFLPDSRRAQGIGYFGMGLVISMTIAPALALYLRSNHGFIPVFLVAASTNLTAGITVLFINEPRVNKPEPQQNAEEKIRAIRLRNVYDRKLIVPSIFVFIFGVCRSLDLNYITIFAEGRSLEQLPLYFTIQTVTMFCIRFFIGRVADKKGRSWALVPGGFAMLSSLIILSFTETNAVLLIGAFFSGLGSGMLSPNLQVWLFSVVAPEKRGLASAAYYNFIDIGGALGAPLMGLIAEIFGFPFMFRAGACAAALYIMGYFIIGREKKIQS